jgi:hypothetical protein
MEAALVTPARTATATTPDGIGPVSSQTLDALGDEIAELAAHIHAATYRLLCLIRRFDEAGGWVHSGARSCAHWLSWRIGVGPVTAREKVRVAHALGKLPRLSKALSRGEISYSKVRAVTRVATPQNEETLLTYARCGTAAQLERVVRHYRGVLRAQAIERDNDRQQQRGLRTWVDDDGMVVIEGRLPPELGAVVLTALQRAEAELAQRSAPRSAADRDGVCAEGLAVAAAERADCAATGADSRTGSVALPASAHGRPTAAQQRADALALVAQSALDHEMQPGSAADRTQIVLHVDAEALAEPDAPGRCAVEGISDVSAETARRLACDASVVTVVHGIDGRVLDVGRKTRSIPPAIRRALAARDQGCCFPGCDCRRHLQAHHIRHWAEGGPTKLSNLLYLCSFHHRLLHEGGYSVHRDPDTGALCFTRPDGRALPAIPAPPAAAAAPPPGAAVVAVNQSLGLNITADTVACSTHNGDPDYGWAVDLLMRADGHLS